METPNYYAIIPANVRYAKITPNAKLLYGEITALCNKEGYCWANNTYFSNLYDVENRSITNWLSELSKKGFIKIEVDKEGGNKRKIYLSIISSIPIEKIFYTPIEKIFLHNNTSNNNTNNKKSISEKFSSTNTKRVGGKSTYPPEFEEIRSAFPEARSGSKKETYEEYIKNWTYEELKEQIKILKWQIKVGLQNQLFLPAIQRRLKNLPKLSSEKREEKLEQIGFILIEGMHETGDKTLTKQFGADFTNEYCIAVSKKRYKIKHAKNLQSFR